MIGNHQQSLQEDDLLSRARRITSSGRALARRGAIDDGHLRVAPAAGSLEFVHQIGSREAERQCTVGLNQGVLVILHFQVHKTDVVLRETIVTRIVGCALELLLGIGLLPCFTRNVA
jgi:hypothetical protein